MESLGGCPDCMLMSVIGYPFGGFKRAEPKVCWYFRTGIKAIFSVGRLHDQFSLWPAWAGGGSMAAVSVERVLSVRHWNDTLFSFSTTRDEALRFENGQFVMIGLQVNGKPLMRAYSIASANYEENLEFFSI